jgi:nucleoside diphosphate kinase
MDGLEMPDSFSRGGIEGENAIAKYRDIMGATDPSKAAAGTIRKVHAKSIGENSVHGWRTKKTNWRAR